MSWIDWIVVALPLAVIICIAIVTQRYVKSVIDFLAAGRSAGRYLVCVAEGAAGVGLITVIGAFERTYNGGTAVYWWDNINSPVYMMLALTGYVIYRYRETRVLTMAQFLETRYSRSFRIFMGAVAWVSGLLNYGIFPAVSARFFVYFCGLPETLTLAGITVPTFALLMAIFLSIAMCMVLLGGQLQVMVCDCVQGLFCGILFLVVAFSILRIFSFTQMFEAIRTDQPGQGVSLLNPFDTYAVKDFNVWFVLIGIATSIYSYMAWQGSQGFNASALNAHEAKMGKILAGWRGFALGLTLTLLGLASLTFMRHPDFAGGAQQAKSILSSIENPQIRTQMTVPVALRMLLPTGVKGAFAAIMVFLMIGVDTSYLHSWGSIFIQDVVLPFRKQRLSPQAHLKWLRWSIIGVAIFAFFFSLLFRQTEYILMFCYITGAIFLSGAGAVIVGGLYWKKGTIAAAWSAMITGSFLAVAGIVIRQINPAFPLNGQLLGFLALLAAAFVYIVVSLVTCRQDFNMDKMLHRGVYAVKDDVVAIQTDKKKLSKWKTVLLGFDEHFTRRDKILTISIFAWTMFWFVAFIVICVINVIWPWSERMWWNWGLMGIWLCIFIAPITVVWFTWGGVSDLCRLFVRLRTKAVDEKDDGTIIYEKLPDADSKPAAISQK